MIVAVRPFMSSSPELWTVTTLAMAAAALGTTRAVFALLRLFPMTSCPAALASARTAGLAFVPVADVLFTVVMPV